MWIRFSRPRGKPVLTCVRRDGSTLFTRPRQGEFFARHDLMHYAVESTLGLRQSFFGLIDQGWSIESFEQPEAAARIPDEAKITEFMVGQLTQEAAFGNPSTADEFNSIIASSVAGAKGGIALKPATVTEEELARIRATFADLLGRYLRLAGKDVLELPFL